MPVLTGRSADQQKHTFLYFEYPENGGQIAVRIGDWKGVRRNLRKQPDAPWELYNLAVDETEKNNLASVNPVLLEQMEKIVRREHIHSHIQDWEFIDPKFSREK